MKRIFAAAVLVVFAAQFGCDSEDTSTYSFSGTWTSSSGKALCSQIINAGAGGEARVKIDNVRATVYKKESDIEAGNDPVKTVTVPCSDSKFEVDELKRGSYFVLVEALAKDPEVTPTEDTDLDIDAGIDQFEGNSGEPVTRAYFVGSDTVVLPTKTDDIVEFDMSINRGSIDVTWGFEGGGSCGSSWIEVEKVSVELKGTSSLNNENSGKMDCDIEGQHYVFEDLDWDLYTVTITGYDAKGTATFMGTFDEPVEVPPGADISGRDGVITLIEVEN